MGMVKCIADRIRNYAKTFAWDAFFHQYTDSRTAPRIPSWKGIVSLLLGLMARVTSLEQLESLIREGAMDNVVDNMEAISADTLGRIVEHGNVPALRALNAHTIRQAKAKGCFPAGGTMFGWKVAAVDLTQLYSTTRPTSEVRAHWPTRTTDAGQGPSKQYYQQAVGINYVGVQPRLALGFELRRAGEDELKTALRLLQQLDRIHSPTWADVLVFDAYYPKAPLIEYAVQHGKEVVIKLKHEHYHLVRDLEGLIDERQPTVELRNAYTVLPEERQQGRDKESLRTRYQVKIYDEDNLTSWESVSIPLRCLKVVEQREERVGNRWQPHGDPQTYYIVTTIPSARMKPEWIWTIMHRRWDVENSLFNDLKQNWNLEHCYTHHPQGIETMLGLYALAYNLLLLFKHRRLRSNRSLSLKALSQLLLAGFTMQTRPWRPTSRDGTGPLRFVGNLVLPAAFG